MPYAAAAAGIWDRVNATSQLLMAFLLFRFDNLKNIPTASIQGNARA
jgi:hypothetical protein